MFLETIKSTTPEDTETLERFFTIKYRTKFKESTVSMTAVIVCDEFEEVLSYMSTEMRPVFCCVVNDSWFLIRESCKSLLQCKWIRIGIEISSVSKKSSNTPSESIMRLDTNSCERAR